MSSNLALTEMAENTASPEVAHNDALDELDAAITEFLAVDVTSGNATVTTLQGQRNVRFLVTGASVARNVTFPAIKRLFLVDVPSSNTAVVSVVVGATSITLNPGTRAMFYSDGTADGVAQLTSQSSGSFTLPHDLSVYAPGQPSASATVLFYVATRPFSWPANMTGSYGKSLVAADAQTDFDVTLNGVSVGTIRFAAAAVVATFVGFSAEDIVAGDIIKILAPASPDADLSGVTFALYGTRTG